MHSVRDHVTSRRKAVQYDRLHIRNLSVVGDTRKEVVLDVHKTHVQSVVFKKTNRRVSHDCSNAEGFLFTILSHHVEWRRSELDRIRTLSCHLVLVRSSAPSDASSASSLVVIGGRAQLRSGLINRSTCLSSSSIKNHPPESIAQARPLSCP